MNTRNCPNCKIDLGSYDHYFCTNCGTSLPQSEISSDVSFKIKEHSIFSHKVPKDIKSGVDFSSRFHHFYVYNRKLIFEVFTVLSVLIVGVLLYQYYLVPLLTEYEASKIIPVIKTMENQISDDVGLAPSRFNEDFTKYVPNEVDLYINIPDLYSAVTIFANEEHFDSDFLSNIPILFENGAVIFASKKYENGGYTFILKPKVLYPVEVLVSTFDDEYWNFEIVEDYLIVTSDVEVFDDVNSVLSNTLKNVSQTTLFASSKSVLSDTGKIKVIFFNSDGKDLLSELKNYNIRPITQSLIQRTLNSGYGFLIIN